MRKASFWSSALAIAWLGPFSATAQELPLQAKADAITPPFAFTNGCIFQTSDTLLPEGGRALYAFTVTNAGQYAISAWVCAPPGQANSFYINIDAEPQDPSMIWDVPLASKLTRKFVTWRGRGEAGHAEFAPKYFLLARGSHQLIIRGRAGNTKLGQVALVRKPVPPTSLQVSASPAESPPAAKPPAH